MGNTALIATLAAAMVASVALVNADYSVLSSADALSRDEQTLLSERSATSAFEMAASQLRRDFSTWRTGFPATSYLGGSFEASLTGPSAGPVRIDARGVAQDSLSTSITGWMSRLAAASGALTIDSDTAEVRLNGSGVLVSGTDHRASSWANPSLQEGEGLAEPVKGLLASREGTQYAVNQALGTGTNASRIRGRDGDGDVALGGLPTDFATLLGEAVGSVTNYYATDQTFSNQTFGTGEAPAIVHIEGDVSFVGGGGFGLLYVQGSFEASGDFAWEGLVIADGENQMDFDLAGNATIRGAAYITHTSTTDHNVEIGNTTTRPYTLWAPDDQTGHLRSFTFGDADGDGDPDYANGVEGTLQGWTGARPSNGDFSDSEALAFGPDGTLYIVDNAYQSSNSKNESRLYSVDPAQLDGDPNTPVNVTHIGRTYRDRSTDKGTADEVHGLVFYQGKLYGIGARNETVYDISLQTGRATEVNTFTARNDRNNSIQIDARSISVDGDGNVYVTNVKGSSTEILRFSSFPDGDPTEIMEVGTQLSGIGFHPDGYAYGYDRGEGEIYQIDVELKTANVMMDAVSGDIEDMALYFAGEMAALGLNESPDLSDIPYNEGPGLYSHQVSWPGVGVMTLDVQLNAPHTPRGAKRPSRFEGTTLQHFLASKPGYDPNVLPVSQDFELPLTYTGPEQMPMLFYESGDDSNPSAAGAETITMTLSQRFEGHELYIYILDLDFWDLKIEALDDHGDAIDISDWTAAQTIDVIPPAENKVTTLAAFQNGGRMFVPGNKSVNGEILVDEIKIPNPQGIRTLRFTSISQADRYGIGLHTSSLYEEAGVLTVDMSDNASIRYSAEAIGKLALNLPTIASASWFETFNQFASAEVDRMFGVERRVKRVGETLATLPVDTSGTVLGGTGLPVDTGGTVSGGGTTGTGLPTTTTYVCHGDQTTSVSTYSLPSHIAHGDTIGQCSGGGGSGGSGG